jgi:hypothetical protein
MDDKSIIEFFPNLTLKGCQFYFYCPNMARKEKLTISNYIREYQGVRIIYNKGFLYYNIVNNI